MKQRSSFIEQQERTQIKGAWFVIIIFIIISSIYIAYHFAAWAMAGFPVQTIVP